jgi:subtilisin family serine protease
VSFSFPSSLSQPNVRIHSACLHGPQNTISGTSMATPHITGLGAYLLTLRGKQSPQALCSYIQSTAQSGKLSGIPSGTVNLLAYNGNPSG